jgi:hypothetical protein
MTDEEKRQYERKPFLTEITLEFSSGKREARISDLSMGGCYVDTIASAPEGEPVKISIQTPSGESMQFEGEVAYVLPGFGFGIRFTDLTDERTDFLNKIISADSA